VTDRDAPIGVFDSGVGGLTVLSALHEQLPEESTVYLGDTARVPYGPKSPDTIRRYSTEAARFMAARGVKALVIACNTATAHAAHSLAADLSVPVIGVVMPGAREAVKASCTGVIGVIGTRGTIESRTYERAIMGLRPDAEVRSRPCPLFVSLAEEGWVSGEVAELTARTYLEGLLEDRLDTLVLGCTHYPLLRPMLEDIVGTDVRIVDSAEATAAATAITLAERDLATTAGDPARREYYVTDDPERFTEIAERFLGASIASVVHVDLDDQDGSK
jgi:glutamate racemase